MFDTPTDARHALEAVLTKPQLELVMPALVPAIGFVPAPAVKSEPGATRFGGTPDLPPGLAWPIRQRPADADAIAKRGNADANAAMAAHFAKALPYAFVAQVDLAQVAVLGPVAQALPGEGRLLVFYDFVTGPYETGSEVVRVIWDRSPPDALVPQPLPPALTVAIEEERRETVESYRKHGMKPPENPTSVYASPGRSMTPKSVLRLPNRFAGDMDDHPVLEALWDTEIKGKRSFRDAYQELAAHFTDRYYDKANPGRRHQLLGSADPEQDDPRYDAVVVSRFGVQHLEREDWKAKFPEIREEAKTWRLLMQLDLSDLAQDDLTEGTLYILIRDEDLKARRFEKAVAVYQQT